jgi:hypothetical protein
MLALKAVFSLLEAYRRMPRKHDNAISEPMRMVT